MPTVLEWLEIIKKILEIILGGGSKEEAVRRVSKEYGVSESDIWKHGGV